MIGYCRKRTWATETFINGKECVKMKEKYKVEMVKILYSKESLEGTAFEKRFTSA